MRMSSRFPLLTLSQPSLSDRVNISISRSDDVLCYVTSMWLTFMSGYSIPVLRLLLSCQCLFLVGVDLEYFFWVCLFINESDGSASLSASFRCIFFLLEIF